MFNWYSTDTALRQTEHAYFEIFIVCLKFFETAYASAECGDSEYIKSNKPYDT